MPVIVLPSDGHMISVVLPLEDDAIIEPTDLYQLMIVNFSDPRAVVVGDMNTSYIIVNDDDGKYYIWYFQRYTGCIIGKDFILYYF